MSQTPPPAKIYIGIPSYNGETCDGTVNAMVNATMSKNVGSIHIEGSSWATKNFNALLCAALNERKNGYTHLLFFHTDLFVSPTVEMPWVDKMLTLMTDYKCDLLSVVIPLKDPSGLTSTALDEKVKDFDQHWRVRRLTLTEVYEKYAPTFTDDNLLLNTGIMLMDLRAEWAEKICFKQEDAILQRDGEFYPVGVPEDWGFSRMARTLGAKMYATREIHVSHMSGRVAFRNDSARGTLKTDL